MSIPKNYYLMIDTETAGELDAPLVYDYGGAIVDNKGRIIQTFSLVISDVFYGMPEKMESAYYAEKLPEYHKEIELGLRKVRTIEQARRMTYYLIKKYKIKAIIAHNARFDYHALNNTLSVCRDKKSYFFPYGLPIWCTLTMARQTIAKQKAYKEWCAKNGYMTKRNQPRLTAEILYRYHTRNNSFVEKHTGLEDVKIEAQIFSWIQRQHKSMRRTYYKPRNISAA